MKYRIKFKFIDRSSMPADQSGLVPFQDTIFIPYDTVFSVFKDKRSPREGWAIEFPDGTATYMYSETKNTWIVLGDDFSIPWLNLLFKNKDKKWMIKNIFERANKFI